MYCPEFYRINMQSGIAARRPLSLKDWISNLDCSVSPPIDIRWVTDSKGVETVLHFEFVERLKSEIYFSHSSMRHLAKVDAALGWGPVLSNVQDGAILVLFRSIKNDRYAKTFRVYPDLLTAAYSLCLLEMAVPFIRS